MSGRNLKPLMARLAAHPRVEWLRTLQMLTHGQLRALDEHWPTWAHDGQLPGRDDWSLWLIRAGRGFGKTRAGAEWVSALARANGKARIALVGGTVDEVRAVMVEGTSGLIALCRHGEGYEWRSGIGEFTFSSGAKAFVYSAEAPEKLRGPEHHAAWCDELAKWRYGEATWDNLMLGLRLGERPQVVVTTTPQPNNLMRKVMAIRGALETRGGTYDNPHLAAAYIATVEDQYAGTRFGRQELEGELIEDVAEALWSRELIERQRVAQVPSTVRVVVGVDPPAGMQGDACGIVAVALGRNGHAYVLEDASVQGLTPEGWARAVADCAVRHGADRVVAEKNQGGAMVESVLRAQDDLMPLKLVHAVEGKGARAEPVSLLYERGRVWHAGRFPALEDELCGLTPHGYKGPGRSPDRADALVWATATLMLGHKGEVGVRGL